MSTQAQEYDELSRIMWQIASVAGIPRPTPDNPSPPGRLALIPAGGWMLERIDADGVHLRLFDPFRSYTAAELRERMGMLLRVSSERLAHLLSVRQALRALRDSGETEAAGVLRVMEQTLQRQLEGLML